MKIFGVNKRRDRQELQRIEPVDEPEPVQPERAQVGLTNQIVALPVGPQIRPGVYINPILPPPDEDLPEYIDEEIDEQPNQIDERENNLEIREASENRPEN